MAIEKNIEIDYGTSYGKYHRIAKTESDYMQMQVNAYVRHYANENYRQEEKDEFDGIKTDIARIKELEAIPEEKLTESEKEEKLKLISSQYQESRMVNDRSLVGISDTKYTFEIEEENDVSRDVLYEKIMATAEYKRAKEV